MPQEYTGEVIPLKEYTGEVIPSGEESGGGVGTSIARAVAPTLRGASPYLAGAAAGAAMGAPAGGVGAIPGAIAGAGAVGLTDLGLSLYNPVAKKFGLPQAPTTKEVTDKILDKMGFPRSQTGVERTVESVAGGGVGALTGAKASEALAQHLAPGIMKTLMGEMAAAPGAQTVSGATSGGAAQVAAEAGAGPIGQIVASTLAGGAPGVASAAARHVPLGLSTAEETQRRVARMRATGVTPDVASAAPSMLSRAASRAMSGTETMQAHRAAVTTQLEAEANRIADSVGKATNPNMAGKVIEKALGPDGFLKRASAIEGNLWEKWWARATKGGGEMPVNNTLGYLRNSQQDIRGAQNLSELMKDKQIGSMLEAINQDMAPKVTQSGVLGPDGKPVVHTVPGKTTMPYEALKKLRTLIGEKLEPGNLSPDISRSALEGLYGALSQDMGAYAKQLGPDAERLFNRANMFTRGKHDRIDTYLQTIQGKRPYTIWKYAVSPDSVTGGGHQFLTMNRSMSPAEREVFHATFIKQMGKDETGAFNPRQFAQKYDSLSPMVKAALLPDSQRPAMDRLVNVIKDLDKGGTLGTNKDSSPYLGAYMLMGALLHAHPKAFLTVALASSKSEKLAKMLTDPDVINHISGVNHVPVNQAAVALRSLANVIHTIPADDQ